MHVSEMKGITYTYRNESRTMIQFFSHLFISIFYIADY